MHVDGLDLSSYQARFDGCAEEDFPELKALLGAQLAHKNESRILLTPEGFERADAIGPFLQSEQMRSLMDYHDYVKAKPDSLLNLREGLKLVQSLLLPLAAFVLGNLDFVLDLFRR